MKRWNCVNCNIPCKSYPLGKATIVKCPKCGKVRNLQGKNKRR